MGLKKYSTEKTSQPKILIVDDKVANLVSMEALLAKIDVEPIRALSGEEALALTLEHDFALALVDIQMPGMDGFELAELLHGNAATEHLPIIFVSAAYSGAAFQIKGVESGAIDFIEKPIVPQILLGKVRLFVELYRHRNQLMLESFQGIVGFLSDGVLLLDEEGEIIMANPAAIDLMGPGFEKILADSLGKKSQSSGLALIELDGLDGERHILEINRSFLRWHGKKVQVVSMRDVTERQATLNQLRDANKELNELNQELKSFTYTVSHDLKAPLITIGGYVGLLEKILDSKIPGEVKSFLDEINDATAKMNNLLNHLLEYSRVGRIDNPKNWVSMSEIVTSVSKTLKHRLDENQVELNIKEPLPELNGDKIRLEQLVQNLLENSLKYMGSQTQPQIEVGYAERDSGERAFYVKDNGEGIDPKHQSQAFALFSRINVAKEGSGVGLALVRKIAQMHGGDASIESAGAGQGTTVWVTMEFKKSPQI